MRKLFSLMFLIFVAFYSPTVSSADKSSQEGGGKQAASQEYPVSYWLVSPVVFISTAYGEKRNIMTATAMFVTEKEPIVAISVDKDHLTTKLIDKAKGFTLIIASEGQEKLVWQVGSVRGDQEDKFEKFSIKTFPPKQGKPLIPVDAAAWLECKLISRQEVNGYHLVLARVVDQKDLGKKPLLFHKQELYGLKQREAKR